jgi:hypothetical protein
MGGDGHRDGLGRHSQARTSFGCEGRRGGSRAKAVGLS